MISRYLFFKTLLVVIFSITYAFVEVKTPFYLYINPYIYRVIYFIFFFVISLVPSVTLTFSLFLYSMTLEDVFYWILDNELPFNYAWYYPVYYHIPIDDAIEVTVATILLKLGSSNFKTPEFHNSESCRMWYYFVHGKTHDLYGLLALVLLNIILYFATNISLVKFIAIADIVISTGIFVDLWSHCFHH